MPAPSNSRGRTGIGLAQSCLLMLAVALASISLPLSAINHSQDEPQARLPAIATDGKKANLPKFGDIPAGTLLDGSFELGTPSAFWNEFSVTFGTPICNLSVCGDGDGTSRPRSGDFWAWFGGAAGIMDFSFIDQEIVIPAGPANLAFYLWNGSADGSGNDAFEMGMDADVLLTVVEGDPDFTQGYTRVEIDLAAYADGGNHVLFFRATDFSGDNTNFALDDITLNGQSVGPALFPIPTTGSGAQIVLILLLAGIGLGRMGWQRINNKPRPSSKQFH